MNPYLVFVLILLLFDFTLETLSDWLNQRSFRGSLPPEAEGVYNASEYERSMRYHRDWTRFGILRRTISLLTLLAFLFAGGFTAIDALARSASTSPVLAGLIFVGILAALQGLLRLPFSAFATFRLEARYGFNKTSPRTFALDLLKGTLLGALLGGGAFAAIVALFESKGPSAWFIAWLVLSAFQILLVYLAPAVIFPLFNRFEPLPEGELKKAIEDYFARRQFPVAAITTMDGSKRSTKANAFFAGFGRLRKLVLFDTLVARHTVPELVAVLAHEVGHLQLKHVPRMLLLSLASSAFLFYFCSLFIGNPKLTAAFGVETPSVYASLVFVGFLYSPVSRLISLLVHWLSRRHEFEADRFSAETYGEPEALARALLRLSSDNLSHLTPHPLHVVLHYTHPPVLKRVEALRASQRSV